VTHTPHADPRQLVAVAEEAARLAGGLLLERFRSGAANAVHAKSTPTDLASEADLAAEAAIRGLLGSRRPDDALLAEEGGGDEQVEPGRVRWIVDPLDGTINYLFGIPQWCVSVACEDERGTLAGVIFDPVRDELFAATIDGATTLNGEPVPERVERPLPEAMVATGFAYDAALRARQAEIATRVIPRARDVRRLGSAALDLAWLAAGRYDAYYERGIRVWDIAAGTLLVRRAGLEVRDLPARTDLPWGLAAGSAALLDELVALDL
jgi:myo-inositol-1(or 4)-monophosphatase